MYKTKKLVERQKYSYVAVYVMAKWIKRPQNYNQLLFDFLVILLMLETTYSFLAFSLRFRKQLWEKREKCIHLRM